MSLSPASHASDAALGDDEGRRRKHPRHAFVTWYESHPARLLPCTDGEFVAELLAHPVYCLASRISAQRGELMPRCCTPSHAHQQQWHALGMGVGPKQRITLHARSALCEALVLKLLRFRAACHTASPLRPTQTHSLSKCIVSRRHFLGLKNQGACLFHEGQRLFGEQRYSDAATSWGQAALLQHGASHAFLSDMLIDGRQDVAKDQKRGFEFAAAGTAMGCAHSKGVLGACYVVGTGVAKDAGKGLALGKESAAEGSCFGQYALGIYNFHEEYYAECLGSFRLAAAQGHALSHQFIGTLFQDGLSVACNPAEAMRWYRLAATQGLARAMERLASMFANGNGVAKDETEAVRWLRLAAIQGDDVAQFSLAGMFQHGQGVAQDDAEAARWYRLAAAQGHKVPQYHLGHMLEYGICVAQDHEEAARWYRLAETQGDKDGTTALARLRA